MIDVTFDFRTDTPTGKDPDTYSPTLRRYHKLLWSKPLPSGEHFELSDTVRGSYLHHKSALGEFRLASDTVIPSFRKEKSLIPIFEQLPEGEMDHFNGLGYTMGGMMIFPGNRVNRAMTINGRRGFHPLIKDRFDHTVECIRRHYEGQTSPIADTLELYADFFALFQDFKSYVEFFLLQDLVSQDMKEVRFFSAFDDFASKPLPRDLDEYMLYRDNAIAFIHARNRRIQRFCEA